MDIAIFGGSFDPFHNAHKQIISICLEKLSVDKLFIIPTYLNPFKSNSYLSANNRLELINILFNNNKNIEIIDYEVKQNRQVSSYETINYLKENFNLGKIYFIIGADNLKKLHLWYNFDKLNEILTFVVIKRDNIEIDINLKDYIVFDMFVNISSTMLRKEMDLKHIPLKIQDRIKELWKIE